MYLVAIAWMYVVMMMSVAEATAPTGTVLGAIVTFFLYGILPCVILMYLMGTPMRNRARQKKDAAELAQLRASAGLDEPLNEPNADSVLGAQPDAGRVSGAQPDAGRVSGAQPDAGRVSGAQPDAGCEAPADAISAVRKEV